MNVFISWSGDLSKAIAEALKEWLQCVLQNVEPYVSSQDLEKGTVWFSEISDQLTDTVHGIICLTRENLGAPWILFEAGALAKGLRKSRVYTLLIDLSPTDVSPPLSQFQATSPIREDMLKLVKAINNELGEKGRPEHILVKTFDKFWDSFQNELATAKEKHKSKAKGEVRSTEEILSEILQLCRSIKTGVTRQISAEGAARWLSKLGFVEHPSGKISTEDAIKHILFLPPTLTEESVREAIKQSVQAPDPTAEQGGQGK
jgi:hypothetical protein